MNRNTSVLLAISAVIVIMGAGCGPVSPAVSVGTDDAGESSAAVLYESAEFDYSFRYRGDWFLKKWTTGALQPELICITEKPVTNEETSCTFNIAINKSPLEKNVRKNLISREEITFAGKAATKITFVGDYGPPMVSLLIPYGEYTIVISYNPADENLSSVTDILGSFSFTTVTLTEDDAETPGTL